MIDKASNFVRASIVFAKKWKLQWEQKDDKMCMGKFSIDRGREKDLKATQKGPIVREIEENEGSEEREDTRV